MCVIFEQKSTSWLVETKFHILGAVSSHRFKTTTSLIISSVHLIKKNKGHIFAFEIPEH